MRRALVAIAVAFGLASWPLSVGADASPPAAEDPIITPPLAAFVVDQFWPARESALTARDAHAIDALETDAAREYDQSWLKGAISERPGGALPRTVTSRFVLVSRQMSYPASFIAVVQYKDAHETRNPPWVYTVVDTFVRAAPDSPWKLAIEAFPAKGTELLQRVWEPATDNFLPATVDSLSVDPSDLPVVAAHRWPDWPLDTTDVAVYSIGLPNATLLACFGLHYQKAEIRPWWHPLHLGHDDRLGLAAGYYVKTQTEYLENRCVIDEPEGDSQTLVDVAQQSAYVSRSGVPAQPLPWLPLGLLTLTLTSGSGWLALRVRPGPLPPPQASSPLRRVSLKAYERAIALRSVPMILGAGLALGALAQWLLELHPTFAIELPFVVIPMLFVAALKRFRRVSAAASCVIPKSPGEVFTVIADGRLHAAWDQDIAEVVSTSQGPPGEGSTYRESQRLRDGRIMVVDRAVTAYVPGERYATRVLNGWNSHAAVWTLQAEGEGTRVQVVAELTIGPLLALGGLGYREAWRLAQTKQLEELLANLSRFIVAGTQVQPDPARGPIWIRSQGFLLGWLERRLHLQPGPKLSLLSLAATAAVFGAINLWFAAGYVSLLAIHEFAHYLQLRADRRDPQPPVFWIIGGFVIPRGLPQDAIENARGKLVGPLMATIACGVIATIYAFYPNWHFLLWLCAGAAFHFFGSVLPSRTLDSGAILVAIGGCLPICGLVIGITLAAGSTLLGVPAILLIPAGFLYGLGLSFRFPNFPEPYWEGQRIRGRLAFGAAWTVMVLCLVAFTIFAGLWL